MYASISATVLGTQVSNSTPDSVISTLSSILTWPENTHQLNQPFPPVHEARHFQHLSNLFPGASSSYTPSTSRLKHSQGRVEGGNSLPQDAPKYVFNLKLRQISLFFCPESRSGAYSGHSGVKSAPTPRRLSPPSSPRNRRR